MNSTMAFRGECIDFTDDPFVAGPSAMRHLSDGLLWLERGKIRAIGDYATLMPTLPPDTPIIDYRGKLLMPGFIDTHVHYPQCEVIASFGTQLLDWLNQYTFPKERQFNDAAYGEETAAFFLRELYRNGTTTAMVFATVHPESVNAFARACERLGNPAMVVGKVMMDRHAPADLCDTAQTAYDQCQRLISQWHGHQRLHYALTPRFAPTSSEEQLSVVQALIREHPDLYLQTHVAENLDEVAWVAKLFPWSRSYLDVYDRYAMLRPKAMFAHCLHLNEQDRRRMGETGASIAFCPTSNLFLGSGLFNLAAAREQQIPVTVATDVGGGTSFSMLQTLAEGYKVLQMGGQKLTAREAFYFATLGGARALQLEQQIGSFRVGNHADFIVLNPEATPLIARRLAVANSIDEKLFAMMMLGDDRVISQTYISGQPVLPERSND